MRFSGYSCCSVHIYLHALCFVITALSLYPDANAQVKGAAKPAPVTPAPGALVQNTTVPDQEEEEIKALQRAPKHGFFSLTFGSGNPQGEFQSNIGSGGGGGLVALGYTFEPILPARFNAVNMALSVGAEGGYIGLSSGSARPYSLSRYEQFRYSNTIVPLHIFSRLQISLWQWVYPYAELTAGVNIYSASTDGEYYENVRQPDGSINRETRTVSLYANRTGFWNYGAGAGLMIKLVEFIQLPGSAQSLLLDIRTRYVYGIKTDYQKVTDVDNAGVTYFRQYHNAGTDMLFVQAGIAFRF
jgi:hypothetical protein